MNNKTLEQKLADLLAEKEAQLVLERPQHLAALKRVDELKAELASKSELIRMAANKETAAYEKLCAENQRLNDKLASLQWVSLADRKPTAEDADRNGDVQILREWPNGDATDHCAWDAPGFSNPTSGASNWTHWRRTNLPVEKVETSERDEFEKWCEETGVLRNVAKIYARSLFDKAREGKV